MPPSSYVARLTLGWHPASSHGIRLFMILSSSRSILGRMKSLSRLVPAAIVSLALTSCNTGPSAARIAAPVSGRATSTAPTAVRHPAAAQRTATPAVGNPRSRSTLPMPAALVPFGRPAAAGEGAWRPTGRPVGGVRAVYETTLVPPGGTQ